MIQSLISQSETSEIDVFLVFLATEVLLGVDSDDCGHIRPQKCGICVFLPVFQRTNDARNTDLFDSAVQMQNALVAGCQNRFVLRKSKDGQFRLDFLGHVTRLP